MSVPSIKLADGYSIPQLGLGFWQVTDESSFAVAFDAAIDAGYRLFDSAQVYRNEQFLGDAIKKTKVARSELFITSKITVTNFGYHKTVNSFSQSLQKLGGDYIDLMLLHFPVTVLRKKSWQALEDVKKSGHVRSIGVSNYTIRHLEEMKNYAKEMPVINQVELHVFLQQPDLLMYCQQNNIVLEAYSPLAHAKAMDDPTIKGLANKYHKSYAQIMLRFLIQLGAVVIPKSVTPERIKENIDIFNFELTEGDMDSIRTLDKDMHTCWNPTLVP